MSMSELLDDGNNAAYDAMVEFCKELEPEAPKLIALKSRGGIRSGELTVFAAGTDVGKSNIEVLRNAP